MSIWLIYLFSMNAMLFGWIAAPRPGLGEGHGEYSASLLENFQSSKEASSKQAKQGLFRIQQRADVLAVLAALASQQKSSQLFWMPWKPGRSLDEAQRMCVEYRGKNTCWVICAPNSWMQNSVKTSGSMMKTVENSFQTKRPTHPTRI